MIDEKKLLKVLNEWSEHYIKKKDAYSRIKFLMVSRFKSMVSHSPKINKWIPCSERLPEEPEEFPTEDEFIEEMILDEKFKEYIVTVYGVKEATTLYYIGNGDWYDVVSDEYYKVIAWQPLPEAYKE